MNWVEQVIVEFGNQIGLYNLRLDADGGIRLETDDNSSIGILYQGQVNSAEVIVYRGISADYLTTAKYKEVLELSNFRHPRLWPLQAACNQQEMTIAFRIPERAFMLSSLEQALIDLRDILKRLTESVPIGG